MADNQDALSEEGGPDVEEVFALVGNEIRANVIRVLGEAPHDTFTFSQLRERIDAEVDSGQFNYHLQQLVGVFVETTDDGYTLRSEGISLYRTIRAGEFTRRTSLDPFEVGVDCYFCGAAVEATYDAGMFELRCRGCDHQYARTQAPPSIDEIGDRAALLDLIDQYNRHRMLAHSRGVCPLCANPVDRAFLPGEDVWSEGSDRFDVLVEHTCRHCGRTYVLTVGLSLLYHPAVISFFEDHDVDVTAVPHWELEFAMTDHHLTVASMDPFEATLQIPHAGETLTLTVDETLSVIATEQG